MELTEQIKQLEHVKQDGTNKVFSMYLNTDPSDPEQQAGEWKIHFKNGLRNFESYLEESNNKEELENFQLVKQKAEKYVHSNEQYLQRGVILFASADERVWYATKVQLGVETEFYWEETPQLDQLKKLHWEFPKSGIILVQQDQIKVVETAMNEILDEFHYEFDVNTDHWRQFTGPHKAGASMGAGGKSTQQDNFKERYQANRQRWYKQIAPKMDKMAKDHDWKKLFVVGESDGSHELEEYLNKPVTQVIHKNMLDHEETEVLKTVFG
ncbi:VLRF1 family aeRF1-type release factor [Virgibacillus siamensis]|uniref:VLRF1 family aeRF1-type release factor n=1 Tax=Virgibacillus siamensis TaxID=480071 RepID=UPI00098731B7|nr:VLRF1 family aeRF1-type release factor [Virgibacillus siamensis]